uniref:Uncharacterized protein n=1 Tax=Caenorhabditis tropicalis TaxID=1561998 RepID=A0A1I7UAS6_9PELO
MRDRKNNEIGKNTRKEEEEEEGKRGQILTSDAIENPFLVFNDDRDITNINGSEIDICELNVTDSDGITFMYALLGESF